MSTAINQTQSEDLSLIDELLANGEKAEQILTRIVTEDRKPKFEESQWLKVRCGWDERMLTTQLGRVTRALRYKRIAGTESDRTAMKSEADKASTALLAEGSKLKDQLQSIQAKLDALERAAKLSAQRLAEMHDAATQLRQEAPKHLQDECIARLSHIGQGVGSECLAAESESRYLAQMIALEANSQASLDTIRTHYPDCINRDESTGKTAVDVAQWNTKRFELQQQLKELKPKAVELRTRYDQEKAEAESLLDFYVE